MTQSCTRYLNNLISKGGQKAYVALLLLVADEKQNKEILKRFDFACIQQNLADRREEKFKAIF